MSETTIFDFNDDDKMPGIDQERLFDFLGREESLPFPQKDCVTVYLAGPIEAELHQKNPHSIAWREKIKQLFDEDVETVWDVRDPNSGKTDGTNYVRIPENEHYYNPLVLFRTDLRNVSESDFIVVNLSKFVHGFGTPFEMGYAYCKGIPIICICEPGVVPEHPFITQSCEEFVYSEEEAVNLLKFLLNEEI